ncbi:MAG: esterase/lipase family protein [Fimbriiglobus sp.]
MIAQRNTPIVLVHGLTNPRNPGEREFFPGLSTFLRSAGYAVLSPRLPTEMAMANRVEFLARAIRARFGSQPVHLVAHSLGGLDARYLVSRLGFDKQARSLITVGTPHLGTSFADWVLKLTPHWLRVALSTWKVPYQAIRELTTEAAHRFWDSTPDVPGLKTVSVAGDCPRSWLGVEWKFPAWLVAQAEGPNDGIVSVASAKWGQRQEIWLGDHLNIVNRPNRIMLREGVWTDLGPRYLRVIQSVE